MDAIGAQHIMRSSNMMFNAKPTTCNRCGCTDVAWAQNRKGKWYLVEGGYCHPGNKGTKYMMYSKLKYHNCNKYRARIAEIEQGGIDAEKKAEKLAELKREAPKYGYGVTDEGYLCKLEDHESH